MVHTLNSDMMPYLSFVDNPSIKGKEGQFVTVNIALAPVIANWRESLFAHEWLKADGQIRTPAEMTESVRLKRETAEKQIAKGSPLPRPVLGLGILDNIEIGSGRDILLVLATHNVETLSVHLLKSHMEEFGALIQCKGDAETV